MAAPAPSELGRPATPDLLLSPYDRHLGLVIDSTSAERVTAHLDIDPEHHLQPAGLVHGAVYCGLVETLASLGAAVTALPAGRMPVGMENHTSFLRPVRGGRLEAVAEPVARGRQTHLWEVTVRDEQDRIVARGTVRLALLEPREDS